MERHDQYDVRGHNHSQEKTDLSLKFHVGEKIPGNDRQNDGHSGEHDGLAAGTHGLGDYRLPVAVLQGILLPGAAV